MSTELSPQQRVDRALSEIRQGITWLNRNGQHAASDRYQDFLANVAAREIVLRVIHDYTGCVMPDGRCDGEYACTACAGRGEVVK